MKRIEFTERNRSGNLLHIEVPGAIVNIWVGLHDRLGRTVTAVSISPDDESRSPDPDGHYWRLAADGRRVIRDVRPHMHAGDPAEDARECVFCGADIEQGTDGLWADVAEMPAATDSGELTMDDPERLICRDAEPRGAYPGLHEPASTPVPGVNLDNQLYS